MIGIDIQEKIDIHIVRVNTYYIEKEYLLKMMMGGPSIDIKPISFEGMPSGKGARTVTLDRQWEAMQKLQNMIDNEEWAIEELEKQLKEIESIMNSTDSIDLKVQYLRDAQHMSLQTIADKLVYTYDYIKQISCRNPRKHTI